jgi:hypothetical protein
MSGESRQLEGKPDRNARRFPPPWSVEQQEACFVVRDHDRQQLAYVDF